jgi:hypothetical protein
VASLRRHRARSGYWRTSKSARDRRAGRHLLKEKWNASICAFAAHGTRPLRVHPPYQQSKAALASAWKKSMTHAAEADMTMADLDGRIASALSEPPLPSSEVATLIVQARTAVTEAQARAAAAKRRALNPRLPRGEVERARQAMESDHFIAERLQVALVELDARHGQLLADEEDARRIVRYAEVVAERDAAAAELREIYLPFAERFRDLMTRIGRIDIEVGIVNRHLPREKMPLADVEAVARGVCRNWHRQQSDLAVVYDRGAAGLGQRDLCVAAELANRRLIPNCGDIDSSVPPSASEHRAHIPLDHRTFLQ